MTDEAAESEADTTAARELSILLVEDDPAFARLVQRALSRGFGDAAVVHHCSDLAAAVERLGQVRMDVAIVDLKLPDSDGLKTFRAVRSAAAGLPVVLLSGLQDESLASQLLVEGAESFLLKGQIRPLELKGVVQQALEAAASRPADSLRVDDIDERPVALSTGRTGSDLKRAVERAQGLVCAHDLDGRFLAVSLGARRNLGYGGLPYEGLGLQHLVPSDLHSQLESYLREIRDRGLSTGLMQVQHQSGERRVWAYNNVLQEPKGGSPYVLGQAHDVTDLVRSQQSLRRAKSSLQDRVQAHSAELRRKSVELVRSEVTADAILQAIPDLVFRLDRDARVLDYRAPDPSLLMTDPETIIGSHLADLMPPDFAERCQQLVAETLDSRKLQSWTYELPLADGRRSFEARFAPGNPGEVVAIVRDVTEQQRTAAELETARTLAAIGQMVASVAHEVRNPVFCITSAIEAAEAEFGRQKELEEYFDVIRDGAQRLSNLMTDLLDYSKPRAEANAVPFELDAVIEAAAATCEPLAKERGVAIEFELGAPGRRLVGQADGFQRALQNLLENALQFSPSGSSVRLCSQDLGGRLRCQVLDAGSGFNPAEMGKVLQPFYSRRRGGTGLGLALAKRIAEEHDGILTLGNRAEGGARVGIEVPALAIRESEA
ncbi:MAG: PAS domain-containing protein [Myxococcales bacterium]|nr:PAS domain-containing protein [Myxococcales bacterium]